MSGPTLLRGATAIGDRLGVSARAVTSMIRQRAIPAWLAGGTPYATPAALDDWRELSRTGKLPKN